MRTKEFILAYAREVLEKEAKALLNINSKLDNDFAQAVQLILETINSGGRVIVTGVGKSGHVGRKIAATMASLGTPCYFVHSDEALHGDLGMITSQDVVIAISHSGRTEELLAMVSRIKNFGNKIIAMVRDKNNPLAEMADIVVCTHVEHEADHLDTAPTASSTVTLALGDALAVAIARLQKFDKQDFLKFHPGGALGKKLSEVVQNGKQ